MKMTCRFSAILLCVMAALMGALDFGVAGVAAAEIREATPAVVNPPIRWKGSKWLSLDGTWQFAKDPKLIGERQGWYKADVELPEAMEIQVPAAWETQGIAPPGMSHTDDNRLVWEPVPRMLRSKYLGAGWYKRTVTLPKDWSGKQIWLKVGGINSQGWLYVNGTFVSQNWAYCGTYKYKVTDLMKPGKDNVIAVLVRNDLPSRRGESNNVAQYGGIFRSIELEATENALIEDVCVTPQLAENTARVRVTLRNAQFLRARNFKLIATVRSLGKGGQGQPQAAGKAELDINWIRYPSGGFVPGDGQLDYRALNIPIDSCVSWSPENPHLYAVEVLLEQNGKVLHGWVERFGMRQWEIRGGDFYLNGQRYYLRGAGDDHVYPITVSSPASKQTHAQHLAKAKAYGFNFFRHHTHNEIPEFFQAADEVGIMVQGELPYWAPSAHMSRGSVNPKQDLMELVRHYRRYTSLVQYCGGNEGNYGPVLGPELYCLSRALDPTRPFLSQDGGVNTKENSDFNTHGMRQKHSAGHDSTRPFVEHEYMSLGLNEDPRIGYKYTGGYMPSLPLEKAKRFVQEDVGLKWSWADACYTAGYKLQGVHHKIGFESARLDPYLDGAICWLMIDISPNSQNGVLDMFWDKKDSTPEYFQQFNGATVILAQMPQPASDVPIYTSGDVLPVDWTISNFGWAPVHGDRLVWRIVADKKVLSEGAVESVDVPNGTVKIVGQTDVTMPSVTRAVKAQLTTRLEQAGVSNAWNIWIFPQWQQRQLKNVAVSPSLYSLLAKRYRGIEKLEKDGKKARVVVANKLYEPGVLEALDAGGRVILLELPGYNPIQPGFRLGWWGTTNQTGTTIAKHAAFGSFPHEGWLDQVFWRLIGTAEKLDVGHQYKTVEPLVLGIGRKAYVFGGVDRINYLPGFNLSVFQARAGKGRLLCSGLNLRNNNPESVYLMDEFITYALSDKFVPTGTVDIGKYKAKAEENRKLSRKINGFSFIISAGSSENNYPSYLGDLDVHTARQTDGTSKVIWQTKTVDPGEIKSGRYTFTWVGLTGWRTQPEGGDFGLFLNGKEILRFDVTFESKQWRGAGGQVILDYEVKGFTRNDKEDTCGVMRLTVPATWLKPGEPAELKVVGSAAGSKRFFGIYAYGQ